MTLLSNCNRRLGLFVVDLDNPFNPPRWLHHLTSWEVADVQWSPHASRPSWVVSTSNQKAMLWNLALPSNRAIEHVIHGHTRAITDINFHSKDPEMLATSSIDSYIHCWDMRNPRKPAQSFAEFFSGANQVKWSRHNENIIASAHDSRVFIWDKRKNSIPVAIIKAHPLKVNGLDFSRTESNKLMTCSNDRTVKIWNFEKDLQNPVYTIATDFPVGRARFTPFGSGAVIMPSRGGRNSLSLVDIKDKTGVSALKSEYDFTAHTEPVREFVWRSRGSCQNDIEDRDFQLVTWSKDKDVRLWPLTEATLEKVHYKKGQEIRMPLTRKGAPYVTYHSEPTENKPTTKVQIKASRGSYGSSPGTFRAQLLPTGGAVRTKPGAAFMTRAGNRTTSDAPEKSNLNPHLQWISGVRIGQSAFTAPFDQSGGAIIQPSIDTPANLGEEVSLVGHRFPRVNFERIAVPEREIRIALNGSPNGFENVLVFLRVEIKFPLDYPYHPPHFSIEENYKLSSENIQEIEIELAVFAEKLASHGIYCLEPCVRILLGEQVSLRDYINEDNSESDLDMENLDSDPLFDMVKYEKEMAYSSSSSDGEVLVDNTQTYMPPSHDSTPIPKGCGAYWSKGGFLVCFFMKKEKPKPNSNLVFNDRNLTSMRLKLTSSNILNENDDSDDEYYSYSGSDEALGNNALSVWMAPGQLRHNIKPRHIGHGPLSATNRSQGTHQSGDLQPKNIIRILDFRHLIPARRELAAEYEILGSYPKELCRHNSQVAEKHGCHEVADCWRLIEMILTTQLSLPESAGMLVSPDDTGIASILAKGAFQWGNHPFGRRWLVEQLFDYFEKQQNPQMLANMSCIFASVSTAPNPLTIQLPVMDLRGLSSQFNDFSRKGLNHSALPTPFFSGKFNPWDFTIPSPGSFTNKHEMEALAMAVASGHIPPALTGGISKGVSTSALTAEASPVSSKDSSLVSSSPEKFSTSARRAVAGIFSRTGSQMHTHMTPAVPNSSYKRESNHPWVNGMGAPTSNYWTHLESSPVASASNSPQLNSNNSLGSHTSGLAHGEDLHLQMMFNTNPATRLASRTSINGLNEASFTDYDTENPHQPRLNVTILGEALMDHGESLPPISLLDPAKDEKYKLYRMQYAGILFSWGLEIESLEVLKFNYTNLGNRDLDADKSVMATKRPSDFEMLHSANIQFHIHSQQYDPETIDTGPMRSTYHKACQYCGLSVRRRFFFCLYCEHILHATCANRWWKEHEADECASGCGCRCLDMI